MTHRVMMLACTSVIMLSSCGCLLNVAGTSKTEGEVPRAVTDSVIYGETTRAWVVERLGEPDRCSQGADGSEVLTYEYTKTEKAKFSVLFLIGFSARNEKILAVNFELRDGVVQNVRRKAA